MDGIFKRAESVLKRLYEYHDFSVINDRKVYLMPIIYIPNDFCGHWSLFKYLIQVNVSNTVFQYIIVMD